MNIDKLNVNKQMTEVINNQNNIKQDLDEKLPKDIAKEKPAAVYEKGSKDNNKAGSIYNKEAILKLKQETENNRLKIIEMVQNSINRQNNKVGIANLPAGITSIDAQAKKEAQAMLAEDGELGVEKTSQRLVDFAIALSGGDTSKADLLRNAIEKGFSEAKRMLGGKLPKISEDTYTATMEKFDAWAKGDKLEENKKAEKTE